MIKNKINYVIIIIGLILLTIVLFNNLFFKANISNDVKEIVKIQKCDLFTIVLTIFTSIGIYVLLRKISKIADIKVKKRLRIILIVSFCLIYFVCQVVWINYANVIPRADQLRVYNTALEMQKGENITNKQYLELFPQQLTLAHFWSIIFKIIRFNDVKVIQYMNAFSNVISLLFISIIAKKIDKNSNQSVIVAGTIFVLFFAISLLSTFVYGDISGMMFALISMFFIMEYEDKKKKRYFFISALCMAMGNIIRMNNLIILIAICIYLFLNIFKEKQPIKKNMISFLFIIIYIVIAIMPGKCIKTFLQQKYELNKENKFPTVGFLCMGMSEGPRAEGWFNSTALWSYNDIKSAKSKYNEEIERRLKKFKDNPIYFLRFYERKSVSMWNEGTYSAIWYNLELVKKGNKVLKSNKRIIKLSDGVEFSQKALVTLIFALCIKNIILRRKKISNEEVLLLISFCGGFLFHILWEAKSRYIITYIVFLIPLASIELNSFKMNNIKLNLKNIAKKSEKLLKKVSI